MADFLTAKGPSEVVQRRWPAPVDSDDGAASVAVVASGVTATATLEGDEVVLAISGGTAAATGSIAVTVTTSQGRTLIETLYIPVVAPGAAADTAQEIINFALRKVAGVGEDPSAEQADDALERLSDMLEQWRIGGADVGAPRPLTTATVIYCPQGFMSAIKNNLIVQLADLYDAQLSPVTVQNARAGLSLIKQANLPDTRETVFY